MGIPRWWDVCHYIVTSGLEFGSLIATKLIQLGCVSNHPHFKIVVDSMLDHIGNFSISHAMWEGNIAANKIAKPGLETSCFTYSIPVFLHFIWMF